MDTIFEPLSSEIKERFENFLTDFNTANLGFNLNEFIQILKQTGALIAGGSVCRSVYNKSWRVQDLDIYVNIKNCIPIRDFLNRYCSSSIHNGYDNMYSNSFLSKNRISKVMRFKFHSHKHIDLMYVYNDTPILKVVNNFDLSCCQSWYDGENIYTSNPELIEKNESKFNNDYTRAYLGGNSFTRDRIEKYIQRGFTIFMNDRYVFNKIESQRPESLTRSETKTINYFKKIIFETVFKTYLYNGNQGIFFFLLPNPYKSDIDSVKPFFRGDGYDYNEFSNFEDYEKIGKGKEYKYVVNRINFILTNFEKFYTSEIQEDEEYYEEETLNEDSEAEDEEYTDIEDEESESEESEESETEPNIGVEGVQYIQGNKNENDNWENIPETKKYMNVSSVLFESLREYFVNFYKNDIDEKNIITKYENKYSQFVDKCYDEITLAEYEAGDFLSQSPENIIIKSGDRFLAYRRDEIIKYFNDKKFKVSKLQLTKTYTNQVILFNDVEKFTLENVRIFILKDNEIKIKNDIVHIVIPMTVEKYMNQGKFNLFI